MYTKREVKAILKVIVFSLPEENAAYYCWTQRCYTNAGVNEYLAWIIAENKNILEDANLTTGRITVWDITDDYDNLVNANLDVPEYNNRLRLNIIIDGE